METVNVKKNLSHQSEEILSAMLILLLIFVSRLIGNLICLLIFASKQATKGIRRALVGETHCRILPEGHAGPKYDSTNYYYVIPPMDESEFYANELVHSGVLTREQLSDIRWAFHFFDKNGDGTISSEELETALNYLGHEASPSDLQDMIKQVDENGDGSLDFKEFLRAMSEYYQQPKQESSKGFDDALYRRAFAEFDTDGDGFIDAQELQKLMNSLGEPLSTNEIADMLKVADQDGDGRVNFSDFTKVLQN